MKMTGAKIVMECLLEQQVDTVFGYPGSTILNLYDELYNYRDRITHIRTAHEQGAAHAADGYARSTGRVGVCFATSGPGSTNLVTGIATAYMDSSPVVFITCNVGRSLIGKDSFQEVDITGMIGMHGSQASNMAVDGCDLLIAFGCRFSDRVALDPSSFARQAKIVHVDIDRSEINKNVMTDHHIVGDAKRVLELLNERVMKKDHTPWKEYVFSFPTETEYTLASETLNPRQITDSIDRLCPRDVMVATDVGQHQMWTIQHLHYSYPGQLLTSGGFGAMGFGLGAAIEGGGEAIPDNILIYATSNRRHLIRETWNDRQDMEHQGDIHRSDTMEEKLSLSGRFGLQIFYPNPNFEEYHTIVRELAGRSAELSGFSDEQLRSLASTWQVQRGNRSGRTARQFVNSLITRKEKS